MNRRERLMATLRGEAVGLSLRQAAVGLDAEELREDCRDSGRFLRGGHGATF